MATLHGRGGMVYLQGSGATATKLGQARTWSIDIDKDLAENNALGDSWVTQLAGLLKWKGKCDGNFDTAETSPFDAAAQTGTKKLYIYPDSTSTTTYYYGTVHPKLSVTGGFNEVTRFSLTFDGDGQLAKN